MWIFFAALMLLVNFQGCILHKAIINYGEVFQNEHVAYVKPIKDLACADQIQKMAKDSVQSDIENVKFYEINANEYGMFFTTKIKNGSAPNSSVENEYLFVFDKKCNVIVLEKHP